MQEVKFNYQGIKLFVSEGKVRIKNKKKRSVILLISQIVKSNLDLPISSQLRKVKEEQNLLLPKI